MGIAATSAWTRRTITALALCAAIGLNLVSTTTTLMPAAHADKYSDCAAAGGQWSDLNGNCRVPGAGGAPEKVCNLVLKAQNEALPGLGGGGTTGVSDEEGEYIVYQMRDGYGLSAGETFRLINTATGTHMCVELFGIGIDVTP
jgi:hypothetical protein